ncbi:MAG: alkene reductase [Aquimonas sp.]|nr:alkene reductase [Aquimonas sp.]
MNIPTLFAPFKSGALDLANRLVMAPLTRNRAGPGQVPTDDTVTYYRQRASAGLIITEASQISPMGQGYLDTPGIHSPEQIAAWKRVTEAVHAEGGRIFIQLWHVGRISHSSLLPGGAAPVAPSAITANSKTFTAEGFVDVSAPRAMSVEDIQATVADYAQAARNAIEAGFDGVEVHAANGYLIDQFLRESSNHREDAYGGGIENRTRFLAEVMDAIVAAIGAERVGVRFSPVSPFNDVSDSNPQALFEHAIERIDHHPLAYVHVIEGATGGDREIDPGFDFAALRAKFKGAWMVNNGYDHALAEARLAAGAADLFCLGRPFISNPDLVRRLREGRELNPLDGSTLYGGGAEGYTDYPFLAG